MRLLVDADGWRYRYGFAAERWEDPILPTDDRVLIVEPFHNVVIAIQQGLKKHMDLAGCDSYELFLSGYGNFRYEVDPTYKANRMEMPKPFHYNNITEYMVNMLEATVTEGYEADDALAIEQTRDPEGTVVCTQDKDLDQVPGWKYNFVKEELYYVTPHEAEYNLWHQVLTGDRVDNIPGVPGIGPVRADKILSGVEDDFTHYAERVVEAYKKVFPETYINEYEKNLKLVRLLRNHPEDDIPW